MAEKEGENIIAKIIALVIFLIALCLALAIFLTALCYALCMVLLPIVLLAGAFVYQFQFINYRKKLNNDLSDFWLNEEEKKEFKDKSLELNKCTGVIAHWENEGHNAGISRNMDGEFSLRSDLGKKIRQIRDKYIPEIDELNIQLKELKARPLKKWTQFNSIASNSKAMRVALNIWVAITLLCLFLAYRQGAFEFENAHQYLIDAYTHVLSVLTFGAVLGDDSMDPLNAVKITIFPFTGTLISFCICKGIFSNHGTKFSPKPPKVTLANIDLPEANNDVPACNQNFKSESEKAKGKKKKLIATILAIIFGIFGVHKFYLGSWGWGIIYILFFWTYLPLLVGIAEGIKFAFMKHERFNQRYNDLPSRAFKW